MIWPRDVLPSWLKCLRQAKFCIRQREIVWLSWTNLVEERLLLTAYEIPLPVVSWSEKTTADGNCRCCATSPRREHQVQDTLHHPLSPYCNCSGESISARYPEFAYGLWRSVPGRWDTGDYLSLSLDPRYRVRRVKFWVGGKPSTEKFRCRVIWYRMWSSCWSSRITFDRCLQILFRSPAWCSGTYQTKEVCST